jgi:dipeptidyl aminopeptidase/acylaminoacyl peptidase
MKMDFRIIGMLLVLVVVVGALNLYIYQIKQVPTVTPLPLGQVEEEVDLAYLKDGYIYVGDGKGEDTPILNLENEEGGILESLLIKISPDKKYLAYLGTSGGLDSALKIFDIKNKTKIYEEVYGSSELTDFDWSPDSTQIVVALNLMSNQNNFESAIYLVNLNVEERSSPLFKPENIKINRVRWVDKNSIYYSRLSYAPQQNLAVVGYYFDSNSRVLRAVKTTGEPGGNVDDYLIDFRASPDGRELLAYVKVKDEVRNFGEPDFELVTFNLPDLEIKPGLVDYVPAKELNWYKNYLVGIEQTYGSPDSSVVLINSLRAEDNVSLLDMGPSGTFWGVKIIEQEGRDVLLVWSEFDGLETIRAYELEELMEMRRSGNNSEPKWTLENATNISR